MSQHDIVALAQQHELTTAELAEWAIDPNVRRALDALCQLADFQTQILLSRYRMVAATKLIQLAGEGEGETARKACVDLLKTDLKRAAFSESGEADEPIIAAEAFWRQGVGAGEAEGEAPCL